MRAVPADLAARINSGAAGLCHAWIVERVDGERLGFTDHDRDLTVEGVTCAAASGWTLGAADAELGVTPGSAAATGALDSSALAEVDIAAGLYDGAAVELWRVDWTEPSLRVRLWRGTIRRLARAGTAFTAEIEGPLAALERVAGRTYGRACDASLGDARCKVDRSAFPSQACDKRWATCRDIFSNILNFQGFPFIPGDDWLAAYPSTAEPNDGGKR